MGKSQQKGEEIGKMIPTDTEGHKMCFMANDLEMHLHVFQDGPTEQETSLHVLEWK